MNQKDPNKEVDKHDAEKMRSREVIKTCAHFSIVYQVKRNIDRYAGNPEFENFNYVY